jgi:endoglucanase
MWARRLDYYVKNPISAGGGKNIVYETHAYNPTSDFDWVFVQPAKTLPVVIGELGPFENVVDQDLDNLMDKAEQLGLPYAAWTFHFRCPPNLIAVSGAEECSAATITPTAWGTRLKNRLAQAPLALQP